MASLISREVPSFSAWAPGWPGSGLRSRPRRQLCWPLFLYYRRSSLPVSPMIGGTKFGFEVVCLAPLRVSEIVEVEELEIPDVLLITPERHGDERGIFAETFRSDVMKKHGVAGPFVQDNHVYSKHKGTLRGLHFQISPHPQGKLVRCSRGAILDVAVDLRKGSKTYLRHVSVDLTAANWRQLWIPAGFAHGYLTLEENCEVVYKVTDYYAPECDRGIAWDDADLGINWRLPKDEIRLSPKDRKLPRLANLPNPFDFFQ